MQKLRLYKQRTPVSGHSLAGLGVVFAIAMVLSGCATQPTVSLPEPPAEDQIRPIVAVSTFENRANFAGQWALGEGMAEVLVSDLVSSGHFVVVERRRLEQLLGELDAQASDYFRESQKADRGRLKNVQYFIRGVITDFSQVASSNLHVSGEDAAGGYGSHTARVALTLTVVEVETGQIVSSISTDGLAKAQTAYGEGQYKGVRFGGDVFFQTPLGVATRNAIRKGLRQLVKEIEKRHWAPHIAKVGDQRLIVSGGSEHDQRPGMVFAVRKPAQPVTDPATGDVIGRVEGQRVGRIRLTEVRQQMAIAERVSGGPFQRGQRLEPLRERVDRPDQQGRGP